MGATPSAAQDNADAELLLTDLPDELLSIVFGCAPFRSRPLLSLVCSAWRGLLLDAGAHWRDMAFELSADDTTAEDVEALRCWLAQGPRGSRAALTERLQIRIPYDELRDPDDDPPPVEWNVDSLFPLFPRLHHLDLDFEGELGDIVTPATFEVIAEHIPGLRSLKAGNVSHDLEFDVCAARGLGRLTALESLLLPWCRSAHGLPTWLRPLTRLRALHLSLEGPRPADDAATPDLTAGLGALPLTSLRLDLHEPAGMMWGEGGLPRSLQAVHFKSFTETSLLSPEMWRLLVKLPCLEELHLSDLYCSLEGIEAVTRLTKLRRLTLRTKTMTQFPEGVSALRGLNELVLDCCFELEDFYWASLAQLRHLERVDLRMTKFGGPTMDDFQLLAALPDLREVRYRVRTREMVDYAAATEAFLEAYERHRDEGGVHERVLRQGGSPLNFVLF